MNVQAHFVNESSDQLTDGKLGTFDMSAVPDVGETVELGGASYTVVSRSWTPKKLLTHVTIAMRKK